MATGVRKRQILDELSAGPLTTGQIADRFFLSDGTVQTYMYLLRKDGTVMRRGGRWHRTDEDGTVGVPARPTPPPPSLPASIKRQIDAI